MTKKFELRIPENFDIYDEIYMEKVKNFAETLPEKNAITLQTCFDRLAEIGTARKIKVKLYNDFAPYSFRFYIGDFNGGIIFHGKHDGGGNGDAPTFSVNISPQDGWTLHS